MMGKAVREEKKHERWAVIMAKQNIKIKLEKDLVVVKKWKEDFVLLTTDTSTMDTETKCYLGERDTILQRRRTRAPPTLVPTTSASTPLLMTKPSPTLPSVSSMPKLGPMQASIVASEDAHCCWLIFDQYRR
jgi:hypothetical protein